MPFFPKALSSFLYLSKILFESIPAPECQKSLLVLIFNKVPKKYSIEKSLIENWINKSIEKAKLNHIRGKDVTPFLIAEINALSNIKTLEDNTSLIINNALLSGQISKKFNS